MVCQEFLTCSCLDLQLVVLGLSSGGGGSTVGRGNRGRSVGRGSRGLVGGLSLGGGVLSVSVVDLLTHLLGQGQLDGLAGGVGQASDALLDGLGVDDIDGGLNNGEDGDVVASLLGDLLAVVVAVSVVAVSGVGLADSHHHVLALLVEGHLDGLGGGGLSLGLVGVGADLVVNLLSALGTDGAGDGVALLDILDALAAQLNGSADGLKCGGADLGSLNDVEHGAVVLRVFVPVVDSVVVRGGRGLHP